MKEFLLSDESVFESRVSRRSFLKYLVSGMAALALSQKISRFAFAKSAASEGRKKRNIKGDHDIIEASGDDPYQMTVEAVKAMGGMERFVKKGSTVVVKPNIAWDRNEKQAATTNPWVVAALIELCYQAGAGRVNVFDNTCNTASRCYQNSGIQKAAEAKGAKVYFVDDWNFVKAKFAYESPMDGWPVFRDAIECDTFINVPILKHHGLTGLTLSMKNLMGVCGGVRGMMHQDIGRKLVDITDFISPDLTVIDSYRMLNRHGPQGGNLDDVLEMKKLIVATDPTLADIYACQLAGRDPRSVPNIAEAIRRGFGKSDVASADIKKIKV
ncbi:MAG: DUF362 domain-containing protein [Candidatus Aureabacteria bacterium]|nr:DUF362 domain-containing protein [Candidatus Auribacterota bacterium]